jgi:hypothetical protein
MAQFNREIALDGTERWYLNGELHRRNGPAVIKPGYEHWYLHGKRHRKDGPAIIWKTGYCRWYVEDRQLDPRTAIDDSILKKKYLKLVAAMAVYLVHNS